MMGQEATLTYLEHQLKDYTLSAVTVIDGTAKSGCITKGLGSFNTYNYAQLDLVYWHNTDMPLNIMIIFYDYGGRPRIYNHYLPDDVYTIVSDKDLELFENLMVDIENILGDPLPDLVYDSLVHIRGFTIRG